MNEKRKIYLNNSVDVPSTEEPIDELLSALTYGSYENIISTLNNILLDQTKSSCNIARAYQERVHLRILDYMDTQSLSDEVLIL